MENSNCPACKSKQVALISYCKNCKFPFNGTDKEKALHIGAFINQKGVLFDSDDSIIRAQQILYGIALFNVIFMIVGFFTSTNDLINIIINFIITFVIAFCGFKIKENPIRYNLIALGVMLLVYTLNFIVDPQIFFRGIIFKIGIIGSLVYSLYLIKSAEKFKNKFNIQS